MHLDNAGENFRAHTPTKQELKEMYTEAIEQDPHAALKELHRMDSGIHPKIYGGEMPKYERISESLKPDPQRHDEYVQAILKSFQEEKCTKEFMKNDAGKNMVSLVDPAFVLLLGEILTFGAKKYAPNNWQLCEDTSRYKDALLRHIYAYLAGEKVDPESGLSHLGHAAFGLMCLNYFDQKEQN